jgi:mRNA-degrading endonuclease toxin of MazEF toxin-antitoxin module
MPAPTPREYRQWEVWRVTWDHGDGTSSRRPALLLTDDPATAPRATLRFMLISGVDHAGIPRIRLSPGDPAFGMTGLTKTCFIYVASVKEIAKAEIAERLGVVPRYVANAVNAKLRDVRGS